MECFTIIWVFNAQTDFKIHFSMVALNFYGLLEFLTLTSFHFTNIKVSFAQESVQWYRCGVYRKLRKKIYLKI